MINLIQSLSNIESYKTVWTNWFKKCVVVILLKPAGLHINILRINITKQKEIFFKNEILKQKTVYKKVGFHVYMLYDL